MARKRGDLGLETVERIHRDMQIDEEWTAREDRGFTWWGAWLRQRVWAGEAVRSEGETIWHLRARTPVFRDQPDEPATYAFVGELNDGPGTSAYSFDPADGTISARCGAFLYDGVAPWLARFLTSAVALQASLAWAQGSAHAAERPLDDAPHPVAGPRRDPDDMLNLAGRYPAVPSPFFRAVLRRAAAALAAEGLAISFAEESGQLLAILPAASGGGAGWALSADEHPLLGPGAVVRLAVPRPLGPARAAWLANALNLAEAADFAGEHRPHAMGAWTAAGPGLLHAAFFPAVLFGDLDGETSLVAIRNLLAWGGARAVFAAERLPWLEAEAAARYPDDEPAGDEDAGGDDAPDEGNTADDDTPDADDAPDAGEPPVPVARRSFGPASRTPRPRPTPPAPDPPRTLRELVVDPSDPAAFAEIDDAVAAAEDGDTVTVRPGTYRRPVVVDRAITIRGDGPREAIVLEPIGGDALGIAVSGATIQGLTVRPSRAGNDGADHSALAVHDVAVTVEDCELTSHLGATAWVGGPVGHAVVRNCSLVGGAQNGVWVAEEGRAELIGCRVAGHRWPVAVAGPHAVLAVRDCEVVDNLDGGIASLGQATLVVERTTVARNAGTGITLGDPAPASRVEDCTVEGNAEAGILVGGGRGAAITGNRVRDNAVGIVVVGGATPRVERNELAGNGTGIGVRGEGSDPLVVGNTIAGGRQGGVVVDEAATGRFDGNTVSGSIGAGVWVDDHGTAPRFTGNHVSTCGLVGVLVTDGGGGEFASNDLRGNAAGSWKLDEPGELRRSGNLEDAGALPEAARPDPSAAGARLVN
jgi:parallel beta-helix repeat protein